MIDRFTEEEIEEAFQRAYSKCKKCFDTVKKQSMKDDFWQRMDEICLIYSDIFCISVKSTRDILEDKYQEEERKSSERSN